MHCVVKYSYRIWPSAFAVSKYRFTTCARVESSSRHTHFVCDHAKQYRVPCSTHFEHCIHTSSSINSFWQNDPKDGYRTDNSVSHTQHIRDGLKELREEIKLWKKEMEKQVVWDPYLCYAGAIDTIWKFDNSDQIKKWVTTSDKDHGQGFSTCSLSLTQQAKGLFSGNLSTQVPKDGRIKKAGYCNMKSMRVVKSFKRDSYYDWQMYNHLVLRVRGDGRSYLLNISTSGYYDIMWNDIYHYALYTRGGPYWQIAKIPFSKFFFGSKGRVQDRQAPIKLNRVTHFGISASDRINGPFRLEIDYIGLVFDPNYTEEFAYEMYNVPKYIAAH